MGPTADHPVTDVDTVRGDFAAIKRNVGVPARVTRTLG